MSMYYDDLRLITKCPDGKSLTTHVERLCARVEKLEKVRQAASVVLPVFKQWVQEAGPCDHDVNICVCHEQRIGAALEAALAGCGEVSVKDYHYKFIRGLCAAGSLRWEDMGQDAQWNLLFDVFTYPKCGKPAPAPLKVDVKRAMRELNAYAVQNPGTPLGGRCATISAHITSLTRHLAVWKERAAKNCHDTEAIARRLAEVEGEKVQLSSTVELVKHGLNGPWEPGGDVAALAKEAGDALQSIGLLRGVGDWSTYRELPGKVEAIQRRAEAAEARVGELEKVRAAAACVVPYDFHGDVATTDADMLNLAAALAAVEG